MIATDVDGERIQGVAADCQCIGLKHDVTSPEDWDNAIAAAVHHHGRLDALVSNAGIVNYEPIIDLDLARFRTLTQVHVEGSFLGVQKAVAQMRAQARGAPATGSIVLTASVMANCAAPGISAYAVAKAAMANMARAVGVELGRKGDMIRVNALCPGPPARRCSKARCRRARWTIPRTGPTCRWACRRSPRTWPRASCS